MRDLFVEGVKYAHSASAFKNFTAVTSKAMFKNNGLGSSQRAKESEDELSAESEDETQDEIEYGEVEVDDLLADDEEFTPGTDLVESIRNIQNVVQSIVNI